MKRIRDLKDQRAGLVAQCRGILEKAEGEKRSLTTEEQAQYDAIWADQERVAATIEREERARQLGDLTTPPPADPTNQRQAEEHVERRVSALAPEYRSAFDRLRAVPRALATYRDVFGRFLLNGTKGLSGEEYRAMQSDSDTGGGFLVMPMLMVMELLTAVKNLTFVRALATVYAVEKAESLGVPSLETDVSDPTWTGEITTASEDSSLALGRRELRPHPLSKLIKVSNKLIRAASIGPEALVRDRLAYKFAVVHETAFLTGSGSNQPMGVFTAAASAVQGITTGRDVSTDNTTTAITADNLINCKYTLKSQYWPRAQWGFHRDAVKMIAKLKDGDGQYLWRESIRAGEPDRLLGFPVNVSEYAPNTFTTGLYVGILGDWSKFWIADALDMQIQRLDELYAATNQTGFIGRQESDGMPVLEEAFVRVKLA